MRSRIGVVVVQRHCDWPSLYLARFHRAARRAVPIDVDPDASAILRYDVATLAVVSVAAILHAASEKKKLSILSELKRGRLVGCGQYAEPVRNVVITRYLSLPSPASWLHVRPTPQGAPRGILSVALEHGQPHDRLGRRILRAAGGLQCSWSWRGPGAGQLAQRSNRLK
ncbi:MAG: hypothetical protein HW416_2550 [Chloroflexi bacterium]|nr:hypothetical protein [Chloroflexota bacterium]